MVLTLVDKQIRLSAEPIVDGATTPEECRVILRCLAHFELFSPDERSAAVLAGLRPAADQLRMLAGLGPRVVSLRQGADGSLVYERERDCFWRVPAAPARVVDVTGAGNAYCGGLLVGWHESGDVRRAAAYAAASAAIAIEQVGPPRIDEAASLKEAASLTEAAPLTQAVMIDARRRADRALEGIYAVNTAAL